MPNIKDRRKAILDLVEEKGLEETARLTGLKLSSVKKYAQIAKRPVSELTVDDASEAEKDQFALFKSRFTPEERRSILNGSALNPSLPVPKISLTGEEFTFAFFTDTHIGAKHFLESYWDAMLEECTRQGVTLAFHAGDLIEGMSNRPDQVYSLSHIGYSSQMDYATKLLSQLPFPLKIIDGNHDRWGIKSGGLFAVKEVASRVPLVEFLGHDYGSVVINGTTWMMQHGEDGGGSYAVSYRAQKIVESFAPGHKPHVLMTGHDHKQGYFFPRGVHTLLGGALCTQSSWMRATRKENHDGFWIIKACIGEGRVKWLEPRWHSLSV